MLDEEGDPVVLVFEYSLDGNTSDGVNFYSSYGYVRYSNFERNRVVNNGGVGLQTYLSISIRENVISGNLGDGINTSLYPDTMRYPGIRFRSGSSGSFRYARVEY